MLHFNFANGRHQEEMQQNITVFSKQKICIRRQGGYNL